jgi:hypothetical protein
LEDVTRLLPRTEDQLLRLKEALKTAGFCLRIPLTGTRKWPSTF